MGGDTAGTADLNCPGRYLILWHAMLSNKNKGGEESGVSGLRCWFFSICLGIGLTVGVVSDFLSPPCLFGFFPPLFSLPIKLSLSYLYLDQQVFRLLFFLFSPSIPLRQEGVSKWLCRCLAAGNPPHTDGYLKNWGLSLSFS